MKQGFILTINSGSSSLKFSIFDIRLNRILNGIIERIGLDGIIHFRVSKKSNKTYIEKTIKKPIENHNKAFQELVKICKKYELENIIAVGHRVVHGGEEFQETTKIDENKIKKLKKYNKLAPLHNPNNIKGIVLAMKFFPNAQNFAIFDTGFHATIPKINYLYALPKELYQKYQIRRFGFHGISYSYITSQIKKIFKKYAIKAKKVVIVHLGNGASITALYNFKSIDTSMGFTPLEGLIMGTRSGSIDPGIVLFLLNYYSKEEIDELLNKQSGLKALANTNDLRDIYAKATNNNKSKIKLKLKIKPKEDEHYSNEFEFALHKFALSVVTHIGKYAAMMNGLDAIVFTAGIGENAWYIREMVCNNLTYLGFEIDKNKNRKNELFVSKTNSKPCLVIHTDEEYAIAKEVINKLKNKKQN